MQNRCCESLEYGLKFDCEIHKKPFECPKQVLFYNDKFDEYGMIIHDGGNSYYKINHCPYCGTEFPESKRDLWYDELEKLGFDNPDEQNIPKKYLTNEWYKSKY